MSAAFGGVLLWTVATLPVLPGKAFAEGDGGVEVGILTCKKIPGTYEYYLVHSTVSVDCTFSRPEGEEHYSGRAGIGLGLDLNWKHTEDMAYSVIGGSADVRPDAHSLSGTYLGGRVSATVGVGGGVDVLIGGGGQSFSLQPLALALEVNSGKPYRTSCPATGRSTPPLRLSAGHIRRPSGRRRLPARARWEKTQRRLRFELHHRRETSSERSRTDWDGCSRSPTTRVASPRWRTGRGQ